MSKFNWLWDNWFNHRPLWKGMTYNRKLIKQSKFNAMAETHILPELINANLNVIEDRVLINLPPKFYGIAKGASDAIGETAQVIYDDIQPNGPQIEAVWRKYVHDILIKFLTDTGAEEAENLKSEILRNLFTLLLAPAGETLKALTDEISDDGAQIKAEWIGFLKDGNNLSVILANTLRPLLLLIPIFDEKTADFIIGILEPTLRKELEKLG